MNPAPGHDTVVLRGIRLLCVCGANPEEQDRRQPYEFDIELTADLRAVTTDDLADTIDYGRVLHRLASVTESETFQLFERMAQRVGEALLDDERITKVTVEVRKLRPPVPFRMASAGVRISRSR